MGAVPFQRANAALDRNRDMPATSPTILAAESSPQPGRANSVGAMSHQTTNLVGEIIGALIQCSTACHQFASNLRHCPRQRSETLIQDGQHGLVPQALEPDFETGQELMLLPAQIRIETCSGPYAVVAATSAS